MANTRSIPATEKQIAALEDRRRRAEQTLRDTEAPLEEARTYLAWLKSEPGRKPAAPQQG